MTMVFCCAFVGGAGESVNARTTSTTAASTRIIWSLLVEDGDGFDLDERVGDGEGRGLHERACGRVRPEERRANLAVPLAVTHVGDEHRDLHDIVQRAAARLDDHLDLLEDPARLGLDVALADEVS